MDMVAADEVFQEHHESVVHVFLKEINSDKITSAGTGFIIWSTGDRSLVLTCYHCIDLGEEDGRIVVRPSGDVVEDLDATVVYRDEITDIAVIRMENVNRQVMIFAEEEEDVPTVGDQVVALAFCAPDKDEDDSVDEDESQDGSEVMSENEDDTFVYPDEPESLPGKIISKTWIADVEEFKEIFQTNCGMSCGCSGGPIVFQNMVVGVALQVDNQVEHCTTAATVKSLFQRVLKNNVPQSMDDLIRQIAEM